MKHEPYITAYSAIVKNRVYRDGEEIYENEGTALSDFLTGVYKHIGIQYPKFYKMDLLSKLGLLATEILLQDNEQIRQVAAEQVGIVLSNANASLDSDMKYYETTASMPSPALFVYTLPNIMVGEISIRHKFKGENAFFIFDKFDPVFMFEYINDLLRNDNLQVCIGGWVDVLEEQYNATLFLIENKEESLPGKEKWKSFSAGELQKIYQTENG